MLATLRTVATLSALLVPGASNAATILFTAPLGLTESQEVPPTGSPALNRQCDS